MPFSLFGELARQEVLGTLVIYVEANVARAVRRFCFKSYAATCLEGLRGAFLDFVRASLRLQSSQKMDLKECSKEGNPSSGLL